MAQKKKTTTAKAVNKKPDLLTATQVKKACPTDVEYWGNQIKGHYKTALQYEGRAEQQWNSIAQYLAQARKACNDGGFAAFRERFCPDIGRTRVYELLQIGGGKKTVEGVKAESRERKARQRAKDKVESKLSGTSRTNLIPAAGGEVEKLSPAAQAQLAEKLLPATQVIDSPASAAEWRKAHDAEMLALPGAQRALAEGEAERLDRFFGTGGFCMPLSTQVIPMLEMVLDEGPQPLERFVECVEARPPSPPSLLNACGGIQGFTSALLDQLADDGLVVAENNVWRTGPEFRTGESLVYIPQYGERSTPRTLIVWTKNERAELNRQSIKQMAILTAGLEAKKAFEKGLYWFDDDVINKPADIFCGVASSSDLRKIADLLLRVADEQEKATRH